MRPWVALPSVTCLSLLTGSLNAADCKVAADLTASSPLAGIERIEIDAQAGDLQVNGAPAANMAQAGGKACASSKDMLTDIKLQMERSDKVLHITATTPGTGMFRVFGRASYATLDVSVTIPANLPVKVTDTSGDLEVAGVLALDLKDESGDILVHDIAQDVAIDDDSGDLSVTNVKGNVTLRDSSGDIKVTKIDGTVDVVSDGSGDIDAAEVGNGLIVRSDSSGEVNFSRVHGKVEIPARNH
jgi:DUF4097 and DUF4098 domain-containing protein YvlB